MGFSNGNLTSKAVKVEKGDRGKTGQGFSLTVVLINRNKI